MKRTEVARGDLVGRPRSPLRRRLAWAAVAVATVAVNIGSSNYPIPAEVDFAGLTSVSIWCARFHVSFTAAPLNPTS